MLYAAGNFNIVLGGDLNLVFDPVLNRSSLVRCHMSKASLKLKNMCKVFGLVDIWRLLNPDGRDYTFYSAPHQMYSRIDYFLISKSFVSFSTCSVGSIVISDHAWVCMEMFSHQDRQRMYT